MPHLPHRTPPAGQCSRQRLYSPSPAFQAITSGDKSRDDRHKVPSLAEKSWLSRRAKYIQKFCLYIQNFCLYKQKFCFYFTHRDNQLFSASDRTLLGVWRKLFPDTGGGVPYPAPTGYGRERGSTASARQGQKRGGSLATPCQCSRPVGRPGNMPREWSFVLLRCLEFLDETVLHV